VGLGPPQHERRNPMTELDITTATNEMLAFQAANVTGTQEIPIQIGRGVSVRSVTESIAHRMALPDDVAWTLRDDGSSSYLDEQRSIGDQIQPGAHVTITPKTHLAARGSCLG
jgi:hypothetical protein